MTTRKDEETKEWLDKPVERDQSVLITLTREEC
jgi:hypothetical protein